MKKRFTIAARLQLGYGLLIVLFMINCAISLFTLYNNNKKSELISKEIDPSLSAIDAFSDILIQSKMLATNWVYLQSKEDDKQALRELHSSRYPALKRELTTVASQWTQKNLADSAKVMLADFEKLLGTEKTIMQSLSSFESYSDPMMKLEAETAIDDQVLPQTNRLLARISQIRELKQEEKRHAEAALADSTQYLWNTIIALTLVVILSSLVVAFYLIRSITRPVVYMKGVINEMSKGNLNLSLEYTKNDEIGDIAISVQSLVQSLRYTSEFARNVGNSKFETEYHVLSEHDELGLSLITMRDNLKKAAEQDSRRVWATNGLAEIGAILRANYNNTAELYEHIMKFITRYLKVNQGWLFELVQEDGREPWLELVACHAYDRKKFMQKRIEIGEGLAGQAVLENEKIYLTEVPENYVEITSGLGNSNPRCVLIMPLKNAENCVGVLEIASFRVLKEFEVDFVEKVGETIASTIATIKVNEKTKKLLEESQIQGEQLRTQEEEMRQNMEELHATQEELQRRQQEMEQKLEEAEKREISLREKLAVYSKASA